VTLSLVTLSLVTLALVTLALAALGTGGTAAGGTVSGSGSVDFRGTLQRIDGFGFSEAFQRAAVLHGLFGLTPQAQKEVLGLLFSTKTGAGLSILRLGIGSSPDSVYDHMKSIEPVSPGSPAGQPTYVWDGNDGGQVWLAKQAQAYGVRTFYADAWSAPGFMKTNGTDAAGGAICGLPPAACASGDWRQAYASYLVRYAKFYRSAGVRISDLGFTNEPDFVASYASMQLNAAQVIEMLKVLGPTVARSGLPLSVVCCDATGWSVQADYTNAIAADPAAAKWVRTYTAHLYSSQATGPQPAGRDVWMSEWQAGGTPWNQAWDDGTATAGINLAESINNTLTVGDADAYLYFFGASTGATGAFIQLAGSTYNVSQRLWAMAAYSRYIRPGAMRVSASVSDPSVQLSAFRNRDGSEVIELINTATAAGSVRLRLDSAGGSRVASYVTDASHSLAAEDVAALHGGDLSVDLGARSLTTVVLPAR
jgi:glucosylceramidase